MHTPISLLDAKEFLVKLVQEAGEVLCKYFDSGSFTQKSKGGVDFLTQADEEVDAILLKRLKEKYPQGNFLTEETAPEDYSSLKELDNLWVVDPLDGTANFSRKSPNFAISIGLVDKGKSKLGVVYVPMTKNLYYAMEDQENAYLNEQPIHVSSTESLGELVVAVDWPWKLEKRLQVVEWIKNMSMSVRQIKAMGSAVADLASLAEGRVDAYLHSGLKPWDVAASSLIIEKAGGKITSSNGNQWNVFQPDIFVSNGKVHEPLLDLITKK
jgi:Archaeal fructose-1,6-bisphosphatase and related enzymes of inositol monophosphatase family